MESIKFVTKRNVLLKIKPLTKEQIIIAIDRLTRFKHPEVKYLRVFKDIIISNLIYPQYKKSQLDVMDYKVVRDYAQEIINYSLTELKIPLYNDFSLNKKLLEYESKVFKIDKDIKNLLENQINLRGFLELIDQNSSLNLLWLKNLSINEDAILSRQKMSLRYPIEKIVICEGITEEILLPEFAKLCNYDFDKNGVQLISAGGKNQVVRLFYQFAESSNLPIFVLLDKDAIENYYEIKARMREFDNIQILECGEFEDALPLDLIKNTLNYNFKNISLLESENFNMELSMVKNLEIIFKNRGMHEFKKADFAQALKINIRSMEDVSLQIADIIRKIENTNKI